MVAKYQITYYIDKGNRRSYKTNIIVLIKSVSLFLTLFLLYKNCISIRTFEK